MPRSSPKPRRRLAALSLLVATAMAGGLATAQSGTAYPATTQHHAAAVKKPATPYAVIKTDFGTIKVQLLTKDAPKTVANFERLVRKHLFTKRLFINRDVKNSVVQTGSFYIDGKGHIRQIASQPNVPSELGVSNTRGTLAMAKGTSGKGSSGSVWFFNARNNRQLDTADGGYTVFAKITSKAGLKVLDKIAHAKIVDKSTSIGAAFKDLPVKHFKKGHQLALKNLVYIPKITIITKK